MILTFFRWALFSLMFLIQAGAFLEQEWLTWISGLAFGLFLTFSPQSLAEKISINYWVLFVGFALFFVVGSVIDMRILIA